METIHPQGCSWRGQETEESGVQELHFPGQSRPALSYQRGTFIRSVFARVVGVEKSAELLRLGALGDHSQAAGTRAVF